MVGKRICDTVRRWARRLEEETGSAVRVREVLVEERMGYVLFESILGMMLIPLISRRWEKSCSVALGGRPSRRMGISKATIKMSSKTQRQKA